MKLFLTLKNLYSSCLYHRLISSVPFRLKKWIHIYKLLDKSTRMYNSHLKLHPAKLNSWSFLPSLSQLEYHQSRLQTSIICDFIIFLIYHTQSIDKSSLLYTSKYNQNFVVKTILALAGLLQVTITYCLDCWSCFLLISLLPLLSLTAILYT